ncbi:unnamed protein product [Paramecium pentaurelia]|uniref:Uncharacterized protein n=1 Tax=Paramecium pentaurelia TaxID=43138 RepID=A0A8S1T4J0_9CILI|nr:unnamed protein product [Paramecium pentaurelia]
MSQKDEKLEQIEIQKKQSSLQKEELKQFEEIKEQFNQTNIQSEPSRIQSPLLAFELNSNNQDQFNNNNNSTQSNIVQIDKRFLLPQDANYITYLSENTKLLKEKYVQHCMDSLQSIQEFVINQGLSRQKKQSNFRKNDQSSNQKKKYIHINDLSLQNSEQFQQPNFQETSQKKQSISSSKDNIQKIKEDPQFKEKFSITQKILEYLKLFEIQSSTKKISILEDALILSLVFLQLSDQRKTLQEYYIDIQRNYNYQRSFSAFSTRIKVQRNLYKDWTLENLYQLLKVLQDYPQKALQDLTLIQNNNIKIPSLD